MRSLDTGFTIYLLLVLTFGFVAEALVTESNCPKPGNIRLKQLQVNNVVSTINKPIPPVPKDVDECYTCSYKLRDIGRLSKGVVFSLFDERNWNETSQVLALLIEARDFDEFIRKSEYIKPLVNEELFFYAFTVALTHRRDTQGLSIPRVHMVFPDKFITAPVIQRIKKLTSNPQYSVKRPVVEGNSIREYNYYDIHDELRYFTEDLGMNSHHYHWHVINTPIWDTKYGNYSDRKGELFYWMHRQMVARYDAERLSNMKPRTRSIESWNDRILEGYNPHLTMVKTQYRYSYRPAGMRLRDLPNFSLKKLNLWTDNLYSSIDAGYLRYEDGRPIPLNDEHGIDYLANTIEANYDSVSRRKYGNIHNFGHLITAKITDPNSAYGEEYGPMYDVATSARDPLFYRWHKFINRFFVMHKLRLKPYTRTEIDFPNVKLSKVSVQNPTSVPNLIRTYWKDSYVKVKEGFEFTKQGPAYVKLTHLAHEPFNYVLDIECAGSQPKQVTVRIFIAPVYDEFERPFSVNQQAGLMIQMDKFVTKVSPGQNTITRSSENSTVTMDSRSIFDGSYRAEGDCRCGWPDYLLVPKGNYEGMKFQLFVMLSDWTKDEAQNADGCYCKDSFSYCGGMDSKYRDSRPMGFPYDRKIVADTWKEWKTDNIQSSFITVKFVGKDFDESPKDVDDYSLVE